MQFDVEKTDMCMYMYIEKGSEVPYRVQVHVHILYKQSEIQIQKNTVDKQGETFFCLRMYYSFQQAMPIKFDG